MTGGGNERSKELLGRRKEMTTLVRRPPYRDNKIFGGLGQRQVGRRKDE